jgi:hypothetical protein
MDIIQSQREDILRDDNTAQASLVNILDGLKTDTVELVVDSPMHGSLDLSILKTMKFDRIHTIIFGKGQITELTNVPNGISKLVCSDNLLTELDDLPNSLLYLDFSRNFLTSFDFAKVSHLEEIHCEDNKITEFLNIPSSIISIYCDNNDLKHLDLKGLKKLTTVHCSNNPIIIIDNLPENIHDFVSNNNPIPATTGEATEKEVRSKIAYMDGLDAFYKMKSKYETDLLKRRRGEVAKKRARIRGKCVSCKRPVGTIFSVNIKGHAAICGDRDNPCGLNIKLIRGNSVMNEELLKVMKADNDKAKERIIKLKLDTLFNYLPEGKSAELFKKELESFNDSNVLYMAAQKRHDELYNNPHKRELIMKKMEQVHEMKRRMKATLEEYEKTENRVLLKSAVEIYINELTPEMSNLGRLRYDICEMEEGETADTLYQSEVALAKMEYVYGDEPRVDKFSK